MASDGRLAAQVYLAAAKAQGAQVQWESLEVGQVVQAEVRRKETYGLFLRIEGSSIDGLAHKTELGDTKSVTLDFFWVGQTVRAKILTLDEESRKLTFGLKASYFQGLPEEDEPSRGNGGDEPSLGNGGDEPWWGKGGGDASWGKGGYDQWWGKGGSDASWGKGGDDQCRRGMTTMLE